MTYVVLALVYSVVLCPLVYLAIMGLRRLPAPLQVNDTYEGIATTCLVAVCAGLILTKRNEINECVLYWLLFVIICGLLIRLPGWPRISETLSCAVAPSMCLLGTLLAVYFLPLWLNGVAGRVVSTTGVGGPVGIDKAALVSLFAAVISVPAICAAIFARNRVIALVKSALGLNPTDLGRMEKAVYTILRILTTIGAAIVVVR